MKLIVGLGNPGIEYQDTRHNVGFYFIDHYLKTHSINSHFKTKFNGLYIEEMIASEKVVFLKPLSYMNLSGTVVKAFVDYYKIELSDLLIIHDDLDLPIGRLRLRAAGSSGGHNGLKSIAQYLHTTAYQRVKIGISKDAMVDTKDYVLGHFSKEEKQVLQEQAMIVDAIIDQFPKCTFSNLMNQFNHKE